MPSIAFGCAFGDWVGATDFQGFLPEEGWHALTLALEAGYRAFDGAHAYGTERILGSLLGQRLAAGELQRSDVFVTTKLAHPAAPPHVNISHLRTWDADKVPDIEQRLRDDLMRTLEDLSLGYVDLLLVHWPGVFANEDAAFARETRETIWRTFIEFYNKGAARAIGVSNFSVSHLQQLLEDVPEVGPMVNQVEVHPYCRDDALEAFCREQDIVVTAYAPFASGAFGLLADPLLASIATKYEVSPGQVVLRWHLQRGRTVLPKSSSSKRMRENRKIFHFSLSDEELASIDELGDGDPRRTCPDPGAVVYSVILTGYRPRSETMTTSSRGGPVVGREPNASHHDPQIATILRSLDDL
jgi:diketogulonate reductase-like aldo/keto reductase